MKFKVGDTVIHQKLTYTISGFCDCHMCIDYYKGKGVFLSGGLLVGERDIQRIGPAPGEQLLFPFMKEK